MLDKVVNEYFAGNYFFSPVNGNVNAFCVADPLRIKIKKNYLCPTFFYMKHIIEVMKPTVSGSRWIGWIFIVDNLIATVNSGSICAFFVLKKRHPIYLRLWSTSRWWSLINTYTASKCRHVVDDDGNYWARYILIYAWLVQFIYSSATQKSLST